MEAAIVDVDELFNSIWWETWVPFYYMSYTFFKKLKNSVKLQRNVKDNRLKKNAMDVTFRSDSSHKQRNFSDPKSDPLTIVRALEYYSVAFFVTDVLITAAVSIRQDRQNKFDLIQEHFPPANRLETVLHLCGNT